ncbi:hypothetical protein GCM10009547_08480 [Sporichthya brevicatena]|uniref:FAD-binding domain-containing protein n=1 Tax=Sporichthya brevicatena TaxID=171442 RepID=A0ABN1GCT9_9ACTN
MNSPGGVVVVGINPVGRTTALLLARWGIPVLLLDADPQCAAAGSGPIRPHPDTLDIWACVGGEGIPADRPEAVLDALLDREERIEVRPGYQVTGIRQDAGSVVLTCASELGRSEIEVEHVVIATEPCLTALREALGETPDDALRMCVGRVLLAGDAADLGAPSRAPGLDAGVADAENAAWKLAAVLHEWAPLELLETYHDERHAPRPETLVPDAPVGDPARPAVTRFRQLVRDGFLVLTVDQDVDAAAVSAAVQAPVRVLAAADLTGGDDVLAALGAKPGEAWVIRPDGHVAAVVPGEADAVTAALRRALAL